MSTRPRFGFPHILESLAQLVAQTPDPENWDRKKLLNKLCVDFDVREEQLLKRGFDRAYRQVIEGV